MDNRGLVAEAIEAKAKETKMANIRSHDDVVRHQGIPDRSDEVKVLEVDPATTYQLEQIDQALLYLERFSHAAPAMDVQMARQSLKALRSLTLDHAQRRGGE